MRITRKILPFCLGICCSASLMLAQENSQSAKPEDQVAQVERDWLAADAKGDSTMLRRIIADDFIGNNGGNNARGAALEKNDIIPEDGRPGGFAGASVGETIVRIFGETGVLMGNINTGPEAKPTVHVVLVCQKRAAGWQMVAAQLTKIP
jgi:hypothetical protein